MDRTRSRQIESQYVTYASDLTVNSVTTWTGVKEIFHDSRVKPGPCLHYEVTPVSATRKCRNGNYDAVINHPGPGLDWLRDQFANSKKFMDQTMKFDRTQLPTTNEAGLIQLLAEIDDTIAMFTLRFWKNLNYGALNWGIMPFISDLASTCRVVRNLAANLADFRYTDMNYFVLDEKRPEPGTANGAYWLGQCQCKLRRNGSGDISDVPEWPKTLDRIGFHPDLATAWDLVPFSFVLDYVIPLGNYLESWRGWVSEMTFTGWKTIKVEGTFHDSWDVGYTYEPYELVWKFEYFERGYENRTVLGIPPDSDIRLKAPSLKNMIDMLYLLLSKAKLTR